MTFPFPPMQCKLASSRQEERREMERAQRLLSLPASAAIPSHCHHQLGDTSGTLSSPEQGQSPLQR